MAKNEPKGISLLWKTEDWLAVWVGFLVIVFILAGLTVKTPKFKWTTDGEFSTYITQGEGIRGGGQAGEARSGTERKGAFRRISRPSRPRSRREPKGHR